MNLNKVILVGRLTKDPEGRTTPNGRAVTTFSVATNRVWTDAAGSKQEAAEYHNIVLWGRTAEVAVQYLSKGQEVLIEGRIQTRSWEGKDGIKRYTTEIIGDNMQMGSRAQNSGARPAVSSAPAQRQEIQQDFGQSDIISDAPQQNYQTASDSDEVRIEDLPF